MSVSQRVSEILKTIGVQEILNKTDLGQSALYRAKGNGGVNADTLGKICTAYPQLNAEWVLRGIGEMWNNNSENKEDSSFSELNEPPPQYENGKKEPPPLLDDMEVLKKTVELLQMRVHLVEKEMEELKKKRK